MADMSTKKYRLDALAMDLVNSCIQAFLLCTAVSRTISRDQFHSTGRPDLLNVALFEPGKLRFSPKQLTVHTHTQV